MRLSHSMVDQLTVEAIQDIRARNLLKLGRGCLTHPRWKGQVTLSLPAGPRTHRGGSTRGGPSLLLVEENGGGPMFGVSLSASLK